MSLESDPRAGYVLVVGPDDADRAATEGVLRLGGLEVAAAGEADALVARDLVPPLLLVVEDAQGKAERLATLRRLRAHPQLQGVPVMVLSYDADIDSYSSAITKGAAAYLVKPVNQEELLAVAQKLTGWVASNDHTERRRRIRRPLIMKVEIDIRSRKVKVPGELIDVSGGGCRLETSEELAVGEAIRIILHGYDASTYVALGAEVRWSRLSAARYEVGARFTGTTALLAGKLLGFVSSGLT